MVNVFSIDSVNYKTLIKRIKWKNGNESKRKRIDLDICTRSYIIEQTKKWWKNRDASNDDILPILPTMNQLKCSVRVFTHAHFNIHGYFSVHTIFNHCFFFHWRSKKLIENFKWSTKNENEKPNSPNFFFLYVTLYYVWSNEFRRLFSLDE